MRQRLHLTALLVDEYDKGIACFVGVLGFDLVEDTVLSADKRWRDSFAQEILYGVSSGTGSSSNGAEWR